MDVLTCSIYSSSIMINFSFHASLDEFSSWMSTTELKLEVSGVMWREDVNAMFRRSCSRRWRPQPQVERWSPVRSGPVR